ncbi:MAG: hypothetical protein Q3975_00130 [Oscillospiraceae bacterium]|nr:hypothetical protein [Oscillospiraceae bacterium]
MVEVTGLEGDCADQREAKTSQCDVFKERATQLIAMLTPQQTSRNISHYKGNTAQFKAHGLLEYYSVSLPKKSRQGVSLTLIYLYNLTKNLAAQSAHLNYAVLPKNNCHLDQR